MASISRLGLSGTTRALYGDFTKKVLQIPIVTPPFRRYIVKPDDRRYSMKSDNRRYPIYREDRRVIITQKLTNKIFFKDADEVLDYTFDYSKYLDFDELITSQLFTIPPIDIVIAASSIIESSKAVNVVLSKGALNTSYLINCKITTDKRLSTSPKLFRVVDRFITIQIAEL